MGFIDISVCVKTARGDETVKLMGCVKTNSKVVLKTGTIMLR